MAAGSVGRDRLLWAALGLLIATRLTLILTLDVQPTSDAAWYHERALELIATGRYAENGIDTAFWPVGYPAFLAGVMALFGSDVLVGQCANLALSALALVLMHRWCLREFGDARVAGVAALLLAAYPNHMGYSAALMTEPLHTALLLAFVVLLHAHARWTAWLAAGLIGGCATLVKSQTLLLVPPLAFLLLAGAWTRSSVRRALLGATVVSALMMATLAPWTYRNHAVMGSPVLVSTNGGMSLLIGNNDQMHWGQKADYDDTGPVFERMRFSVADQVAADRRARALAWQWIAENPGRFVGLMPWKVYRLWAYDGESEWFFQAGYAGYESAKAGFRSVRVANQAYYLALLFACAWAVWHRFRWQEPRQWVVPCVLLFITAVSAVFSGQSRYHAPAMPFVIGLAAWTLVRWRGDPNASGAHAAPRR